jgi:predicted amidohydrolase
VKLEIVQFTPAFPGHNENWGRIRAWAEASPADIVLFPELSTCGYMYESPKEIEPFTDPPAALAPLERLSARTGKLIVGGFAERARDGLHNSAYAIGPEGTTVYRKIHLWNREKLLFQEGRRPCLIDYGGRKIGLEVCFDLQFPELSAYLSRQGAELILAPTAWSQDAHGPSHGLHPHAFLALATAYAYGICVAVANRTGRERGALFPGQSCLADPWGKIDTLGPDEERRVLDIPFAAIPGAKKPSPHNNLQTDHRMVVQPPVGNAGKRGPRRVRPPSRGGGTKAR